MFSLRQVTAIGVLLAIAGAVESQSVLAGAFIGLIPAASLAAERLVTIRSGLMETSVGRRCVLLTYISAWMLGAVSAVYIGWTRSSLTEGLSAGFLTHPLLFVPTLLLVKRILTTSGVLYDATMSE